MATRLNQVLAFEQVLPGGVATLPHEININGVAVLPDVLFPGEGNFSLVSATTTEITVRNDGDATADLNLWLWRQHTIDRAYGASSTTNLSPQPFWVSGGNGSSGSGNGNDVVLENGSGGTLAGGTPVYSSADGAVSKGDASADATSLVVGLVVPQAGIAPGDSDAIRTAGPLTLPTAVWDVITGGSGGLTVNAQYYLSATTPGKLTLVAPSALGDSVVPLGSAVSSTTLVIARDTVVPLPP